jgi:predicted Fe-Mo cluster-binding NifX family protein
MRIAIAATSTSSDALVATHAARAPCYVLFDTDTGHWQTLTNPAAQVERGAGPQAARFLADQQVTQVMAGEFGPRFDNELEAHGITRIRISGTVSKAVEALGNGSQRHPKGPPTT